MDKDLLILSNWFNASKLSLNGKITVSAPSGQLYWHAYSNRFDFILITNLLQYMQTILKSTVIQFKT